MVQDSDRIAVQFSSGYLQLAGFFLLTFAVIGNIAIWSLMSEWYEEWAVGWMTLGGYVKVAFAILSGLFVSMLSILCFVCEISLAMDAREGLVRYKILRFKWERRFRIADVRAVHVLQNRKVNPQNCAIGFELTTGRTLAFGSSSIEDETRWIAGELHAFLKTHRTAEWTEQPSQ